MKHIIFTASITFYVTTLGNTRLAKPNLETVNDSESLNKYRNPISQHMYQCINIFPTLHMYQWQITTMDFLLKLISTNHSKQSIEKHMTQVISEVPKRLCTEPFTMLIIHFIRSNQL